MKGLMLLHVVSSKEMQHATALLDSRNFKKKKEESYVIKKENKGGAPFDNKNGLKLKDPEIRQLAYLQYCEHLAKGKSKKSWFFEHPDFRCTWETMDKYLQNEVEFDPLHKKIAEVKGFARWEKVVEDSATGKNKDANTASLQMLMRNKYGWDKTDGKEISVDSEVIKLNESIVAGIVALQQTKIEKNK